MVDQEAPSSCFHTETLKTTEAIWAAFVEALENNQRFKAVKQMPDKKKKKKSYFQNCRTVLWHFYLPLPHPVPGAVTVSVLSHNQVLSSPPQTGERAPDLICKLPPMFCSDLKDGFACLLPRTTLNMSRAQRGHGSYTPQENYKPTATESKGSRETQNKPSTGYRSQGDTLRNEDIQKQPRIRRILECHMYTQARGTSGSSWEDLEPSPQAEWYDWASLSIQRRTAPAQNHLQRLKDGAVLSFLVFAFVGFGSWHSKKSLSKH